LFLRRWDFSYSSACCVVNVVFPRTLGCTCRVGLIEKNSNSHHLYCSTDFFRVFLYFFFSEVITSRFGEETVFWKFKIIYPAHVFDSLMELCRGWWHLFERLNLGLYNYLLTYFYSLSDDIVVWIFYICDTHSTEKLWQ
jgi:hypothetical protein